MSICLLQMEKGHGKLLFFCVLQTEIQKLSMFSLVGKQETVLMISVSATVPHLWFLLFCFDFLCPFRHPLPGVILLQESASLFPTGHQRSQL
jgi:hypothetical protein